MPKHSLPIGLAALAAAAVVLPAQAQAEHENRYFGFGYRPQPFAYNPPPIYYPPPPGARERAPGIYEYEVSPGRWVRVRPGYVYEPPRQRDRRARTPSQPREALRNPGPTPVPKTKPDPADEPEVAVQSAPDTPMPEPLPEPAPVQSPEPAQEQVAAQVPASESSAAMSCEAAADIVRSFGFSDVESTSCSGEVYGFDAVRDGSAYSIRLSAANGELTEVRKR